MSRPRTEMCYNFRKIIVIGMLMATLYPIFIETAAISTELLDELHQAKDLEVQDLRKIRVLRSSEEINSNESLSKRICLHMPCGWAVYHKHTRNVEYFMKNACECEDQSYKCVRSGDDLSASAYVYRCRQNTTPEDIVSPEESY